MVGMLQIMTYLLCVYLVFKGIEIYQIAAMSPKENNGNGILLGIVMIAVSVVAALIFTLLINQQAEAVGSSLQNIR